MLRLALLLLFAVPVAAADPVQTTLFAVGQDGYNTFRIPSLIVTPKGTVLAFCEGRKASARDGGNIDTVLKRSTDGGKTWGKLQVVWDDGDNACVNPCPVVDTKTSTIWMLLNQNGGTDSEAKIVAGTAAKSTSVWVTHSTDDGATWAKPTEITKDVKKPEWTWHATGPGVGIQLRTGRLLIPCDYKADKGKERGSHTIFSDDSGKTWQRGGTAGPHANECQAVELTDGTVMLNMRTYRTTNRRLVALSTDGGQTFGPTAEDPTLIEPVCQGSILRFPNKTADILFSNPASTKREKLTVRLSTDDAKTWRFAKELHAGPAAYSCLTVLPNSEIGCLYERGQKNPYETITFATFTRAWLMEKP